MRKGLLIIGLFYSIKIVCQFNVGISPFVGQFSGNPICGATSKIETQILFEYTGTNTGVTNYPNCTVKSKFTLSSTNGVKFLNLPTGGLMSYFDAVFQDTSKTTVIMTQKSQIPLDNYSLIVEFFGPPVPNQTFILGLNFIRGSGGGVCSNASSTTLLNSNTSDDPKTYSGTLSSVCAALPIKLKGFKTTKISESIILNWESETETNFFEFEIERSGDGRNYDKLGEVGGNNYEKLYSFIDNSPQIGINYYRLKMVDVDGSYVYSEVRAAEMLEERSGQVEVFPNPFTNGFTLKGLEKGAIVKVYNSKGTLIYNQTTDDAVLRAELPNIQGGLYNVAVEQNGKVTRKNLIKVD